MDLKESRALGEGRGNAFIRFLKEGREEDCGMLETPEKIRELQRKLYQKAKQEKEYRFYLLYDKVYQRNILSHAYRLVQANKGACGVDGVTFESIEEKGGGVDGYLKTFQEGRPVEAQVAAGWSGVMSLPRELRLSEDGELEVSFVPELAVLRGDYVHIEHLDIIPGKEGYLSNAGGETLEIQVDLLRGAAAQSGLVLHRHPSGEEATRVVVNWQAERLELVRRHSSLDPDVDRTDLGGPLPGLGGGMAHLHLYLDHSVIEVIANDRAALTGRVYPTLPQSIGIDCFAVGGPARVKTLDLWQLISI